MTAKEAQAKYTELQEMIIPSYRSVLDVWQKNMAVDIPRLIAELRSKEKKANFRFLVLTSFLLILALMFIMVLYILVIKLYNQKYSLLFTALTISSLPYLIMKIWEGLCLGVIQDKNRISTDVYSLLFGLGRDLCYFKESDFANGYAVDDKTFGGAILYTALKIVQLQNSLLSLSARGSILANLVLVARESSDLIKLNQIMDEQIRSAKKFGKLFDRSAILHDASRI